MDSSFEEQAIDGVVRSIRALFNDSRGRNMPRVLAAFTGFWSTVRRYTRTSYPQVGDGHSCVLGKPDYNSAAQRRTGSEVVAAPRSRTSRGWLRVRERQRKGLRDQPLEDKD